MKIRLLTALTLSVVAGSLSQLSIAQSPVPIRPNVPLPAVKKIEIDLDKATPLPIPAPKFELKAQYFTTKDGKEGWEIKVPGGRPIATPAYWQDMIFVGGGYGSHEFYAFNAKTGALIWKYQTSDDGPTAAVVEDGYCAFNTESCTVFVLDAKTGKLAWQEWLGDPLMSQPAISKGRLYMAYPAGQRNNGRVDSKFSHNLLCADLKTGKHLWTQPITADAISAPIVNDGKVLLTCQDGTSFCIDAANGKRIWMKANQGTSAPLATKQGVIFTSKQKGAGGSYDALQVRDLRRGEQDMAQSFKARPAPYLDSKPAVVGMTNGAVHMADAAVGFATAPPTAQLEKAAIPVDSVVGGWAYQGARVATNNGNFFNVTGRQINSVKKDGQDRWNAVVTGKGVSDNQQMFSPPALGAKNMYLASSQGNLLAVNQDTGQVLFNYSTKQPITFQPALADGNVYVGTSNGMILCLKTNSKDADGWTAWGGNAQHNKE